MVSIKEQELSNDVLKIGHTFKFVSCFILILPLVVECVLGACIHVASFPGLLHLQFLNAYSMQKYCK